VHMCACIFVYTCVHTHTFTHTHTHTHTHAHTHTYTHIHIMQYVTSMHDSYQEAYDAVIEQERVKDKQRLRTRALGQESMSAKIGSRAREKRWEGTEEAQDTEANGLANEQKILEDKIAWLKKEVEALARKPERQSERERGSATDKEAESERESDSGEVGGVARERGSVSRLEFLNARAKEV